MRSLPTSATDAAGVMRAAVASIPSLRLMTAGRKQPGPPEVMSESGQSCHFRPAPITSGLPDSFSGGVAGSGAGTAGVSRFSTTETKLAA
jgi:hypothetical protein